MCYILFILIYLHTDVVQDTGTVCIAGYIAANMHGNWETGSDVSSIYVYAICFPSAGYCSLSSSRWPKWSDPLDIIITIISIKTILHNINYVTVAW